MIDFVFFLYFFSLIFFIFLWIFFTELLSWILWSWLSYWHCNTQEYALLTLIPNFYFVFCESNSMNSQKLLLIWLLLWIITTKNQHKCKCVWVWIRKKRPSSSILCVHVGFYTESAFLFGNVEFLFCLYFIFSLNPSSETPYIQITFTHTRPIYNMQAHQHCAILFYILFIFKCACICATRAIFLRT